MNTKPQCECVALLHLWDVELRRGVVSAVASVLLLCDVEMTHSHSACVFCGVELVWCHSTSVCFYHGV